MTNPADKNKEQIYIFDACAFIELNRVNKNVMELPQDVWDKLDLYLKQGKIISHRYVYDEVVSSSKNPDKVSAWLAKKKEYFPRETNQQVIYMIEVIKKYPKLIKPENEKEQADPWLVALARDKKATDQEKKYILVTQENQDKTTNLPAAAREYGIESINLRQFFKEIGLSFGVSTQQPNV